MSKTSSKEQQDKAPKPEESSQKSASGKPEGASVKTSNKAKTADQKQKDNQQDKTTKAPKPEESSQKSASDKSEGASAKTADKAAQPSEPEGNEKSQKISAETKTENTAQKPSKEKQKASSLFTFKKAMSSVYDEKGRMIPVTVLSCPPAFVTQVKTKEKDGYSAVQIALEKKSKKNKKSANKPLQGHLKNFKNGAVYIREVSASAQVGDEIDINSFKKGDKVFVKGVSKGKGFSGVVKRWGFGGGPAAHGAEKHRTTGSIANTATQGRVFPGKKMPGHFGCDTISQNSYVVDVLAEQNLILVKGPVPGAKNSLIEIKKQRASL